MYVILNLAIGGTWPGTPTTLTVFPAPYQIDYVRAYAQAPDAGASRGGGGNAEGGSAGTDAGGAPGTGAGGTAGSSAGVDGGGNGGCGCRVADSQSPFAVVVVALWLFIRRRNRAGRA
jgi:MYXO-CTERM domain-containing protein